MDTFRETLASVRQVLVSMSALGLAVASVGGWVLAGRALRPVDRITAAAAAVAVGEGTAVSLGRRLDVPPTGDELARLAATFNAMLDRLQAAFLAQRRFVADASHELRTPLAAIRGNTDVLARQVVTLPDHPVRHDLLAAAEDMQRESRRMGRLLDDLLFLARSDADAAEGAARLECVPVRLDEVAAEAFRTANGLANGQDVRLETVPVIVRGDRDKLVQVALALLDNALRHTAPGDPIVVVVRSSDGWAELEVRDAGTGIASHHVPHIFDRFFRADIDRGRRSGGAGLGLAIAQAIAAAHGGDITVQSVLGQGSTFRLRLPGGSTAITSAGTEEMADSGRTRAVASSR
ncbi:MAG TPA: HAMP domain-containing sensor histidine kinase [Thermomicrobiales bacterium]|nr:HAMP domain-containing sensor histidine kinase [Thermomicrobiales bacterium]